MTDTWESLKGPKTLTLEEQQMLERQNSRLVTEFKANQLEANARKHWDIFYKRNVFFLIISKILFIII